MLSSPWELTSRSLSPMSALASFLASSSSSSSMLLFSFSLSFLTCSSLPSWSSPSEAGAPDIFFRLSPNFLKESAEKIRNFLAGPLGTAAFNPSASAYSPPLLGGVSARCLPLVWPSSGSAAVSGPLLESDMSSSVVQLLLAGFSERRDIIKPGCGEKLWDSLTDDVSVSESELETLESEEVTVSSSSARPFDRDLSAFCFCIILFSLLMSFTIRLRLRRRAPPASAANCAAALLFRFFFAGGL
mmetsp:Transcript_86348/g.129447  ORF Transcript_86348/g.129447 Transcript_86348/m.129447 type:complete len:244 (+) Transcript_86348:1282-2013(+)